MKVNDIMYTNEGRRVEILSFTDDGLVHIAPVGMRDHNTVHLIHPRKLTQGNPLR